MPWPGVADVFVAGGGVVAVEVRGPLGGVVKVGGWGGPALGDAGEALHAGEGGGGSAFGDAGQTLHAVAGREQVGVVGILPPPFTLPIHCHKLTVLTAVLLTRVLHY